MTKFDLKLWHVVMLFVPIIISFFKQEISNMMYAFSLIRSKKYHENQPIQIMSNGGIWEDFILLKYTYFIPFRRKNGGVTVQGTDSEGMKYIEKLSFQNWKTLRTRMIVSTPDDSICNTIETAINADVNPGAMT